MYRLEQTEFAAAVFGASTAGNTVAGSFIDEATSALDAQTEENISNTISKIKDECLVIVVAHRLATVRKADLVIYMQDGRIKAKGSFEQVRGEVPDFDTQAQLMGL